MTGFDARLRRLEALTMAYDMTDACMVCGYPYTASGCLYEDPLRPPPQCTGCGRELFNEPFDHEGELVPLAANGKTVSWDLPPSNSGPGPQGV